MDPHLSAGPPRTSVREDIALSWRRVTMAGLDPSAEFDTAAHDVDPGSSLLTGATPVLEELEDHLRGSNYSTLLVDRDCRVVRRWFDDPRLEDGFDSLKVTLGASLLEENIGTNALGTAMVTRQGISINGREHFAQALQRFSCYGHPIRHPLTKRIEGVLDITTIAEQSSPLLPPLVSRAVHDIEQRLLDGSRTSEKSLLQAFQAAAGLRRRAILAIGEDIVLSNHAANDLLSPGDIALLRALAEEPQRQEQTLELTLEGGDAVSIEISRVGGARRGALLRVDRVSGDRARAVMTQTQLKEIGAPRIITGVPGTGRSTRARELAAEHPPLKMMRPAAALLEGGAEWACEFEDAMRRPKGTVCVDGIDLLPDELLDLVVDWVERDPRPDLIFTAGPVSGLTGRAAALAGMAMSREELVPLSARRKDIPGLAAAMLSEVAPNGAVHLAPSLIGALTAQPWPGNLRELKAVIHQLAQQRTVGALTVPDLPEQYRVTSPDHRLTALDQAERDVIVTALKAADGNKVRAADELGMSRTTLYARMRTLRITTY
ncbi:sigma-54-dependent Fis family transcriptional regulator [Nocardioides sp. Root140]|uniref:sigma-54-dependent Fis family transcriptional regulator n=1 Tax=Nocardioides sp. Root140 TaxID=1736460 RepID=UPI0009E8923A|nr:helix-turn-helix domain-containing protein [Nocardioides sp. Root140]MAO81691.1 transcriptional regulator [Nocardioides sp.]